MISSMEVQENILSVVATDIGQQARSVPIISKFPWSPRAFGGKAGEARSSR